MSLFAYIRAFLVERKKMAFITLFFLLVCAALYLYFRTSTFDANYQVYAELAKTHSDAAFLPGTADNALRQELNRILSIVLAENVGAAERLQLAERGLLLLDEAEKQIDAIGEAAAPVKNAVAVLEASASGVERHALVALAQKRLEIIADIRGLSYRANYHTAEIFRRVQRDEGVLTAAHAEELNSQLPLVEQQFNDRSNLYDRLERTTADIETAYERL